MVRSIKSVNKANIFSFSTVLVTIYRTSTFARLHPSLEQSQLAELVVRRTQLVQIKATEQTRFKQAADSIKISLKRHLDWLEAEIQAIDTDSNQKIKEHSSFRELD